MISNSAKTKTEFALFGGEKENRRKIKRYEAEAIRKSKVATGDGIGERWNLF
jgi:hypothetical protein